MLGALRGCSCPSRRSDNCRVAWRPGVRLQHLRCAPGCVYHLTDALLWQADDHNTFACLPYNTSHCPSYCVFLTTKKSISLW